MVMETRSAKKKRLEIEFPKEDRISGLPDDILHHILLLLPIKHSARTVVLSRRWRYVFSSLPDLNFSTVSPFLGNKDSIINQVLALRDKNSSIRTLKLASDLSTATLSSLIEHCVTNNIQDLDVRVNSYYVHFPWNLLDNCESLKVLKINCMYINFNSNQSLVLNHGFKSLRTMTLANISFISPDSIHMFTDSTFPCLEELVLDACFGLRGMIFRCTELEDLVIKECYNLNDLDVYGLKLERLKVDTCFTNSRNSHSNIKITAPALKCLEWVGNNVIHIPVLEQSLSLLYKAVFGFVYLNEDFSDHILGPEQKRRLSNLMIQLSHVRTLKFHYPSIEILSKSDFRSILVNKFERLRQLEVSTYNNFQGVATLFKNSPKIQTLIVTIHYFNGFYWNQVEPSLNEPDCDKYWEDQVPEMISFLNHLKMVKFIGFLRYDEELISFAKFLLKHGTVLESMILCLGLDISREDRVKSIMEFPWIKSIMGFPCKSPKVKVLF